MVDWVLAAVLLVSGQVLLIALGPLSRVGDPAEGTAGPGGVALLAPDSVGYLADSVSLAGIAGEPWLRWGYLAVLRVGHLLGDAALFAVVVQVVAWLVAGVALLRLGRDLAGPWAGAGAASVLLLNPMTSQWVRFVLTEPLFYALAVGVVVAGARARLQPEARRHGVHLTALAATALLLRPTGPLLAGSALTLLLARARRRAATTLLVWGVVAALLVAGAAGTTPAEGTLEEQLRAGVVVEGTPDVRTTIDMPSGPEGGLATYVRSNPVATLRLAATRVVVEVAQVRRHYPALVNVVLGGAMVLLLGLAVLGLRDPRGRVLRLPTAFVLLPLVGVVGITFAVPEGRYGWAGLVALSPAVGVGLSRTLDGLRRDRAQPAAR